MAKTATEWPDVVYAVKDTPPDDGVLFCANIDELDFAGEKEVEAVAYVRKDAGVIMSTKAVFIPNSDTVQRKKGGRR